MEITREGDWGYRSVTDKVCRIRITTVDEALIHPAVAVDLLKRGVVAVPGVGMNELVCTVTKNAWSCPLVVVSTLQLTAEPSAWFPGFSGGVHVVLIHPGEKGPHTVWTVNCELKSQVVVFRSADMFEATLMQDTLWGYAERYIGEAKDAMLLFRRRVYGKDDDDNVVKKRRV